MITPLKKHILNAMLNPPASGMVAVSCVDIGVAAYKALTGNGRYFHNPSDAEIREYVLGVLAEYTTEQRKLGLEPFDE